jgi:hypothetical protein
MIELEPISKSDWAQWKQNPVTKRFVADILENRTFLLEGLAEGNCVDNDSRMVTIGRTQGLKDAAMYVIEGFSFPKEEEKDVVKSDSI